MLGKRGRPRPAAAAGASTGTLLPSRYNFAVSDSDASTILFNAASRAVGRFTAPQRPVLERILERPNESVAALGGGPAIKAYLLRAGFLVDAGHDEVAALRLRNRGAIEDRNARLELTLLPTLDCNFRCFYCYEQRRPERMSDQTVAAVLRFLEKTVPGRRALQLSWFGGEPLLELDTLLRISGRAARIAAEHHARFRNFLTTNGYLLDQETVERLAEAGIDGLSITIDGPRRWHDRFRPHRDGQGTFEQVLAGLTRAARRLPRAHVQVRVNYNARNLPDVEGVLDQIPDDLRGRLAILARPIFGRAAARCGSAEQRRGEGVLYRESRAFGLDVDLDATLLGPKETFCYADRRSSLIIGPSGGLFKCAVGDFSEASRMGRLMATGDTVWDKPRIAAWNQANGFESRICRECRYLPLCMGGCRAQRVSGEQRTDCQALFEHLEGALLRTFGRRSSKRPDQVASVNTAAAEVGVSQP